MKSQSSNRSFGLLFFAVFLILGLWPLKMKNDEECFIVVEDNGPGIPENNYEDVFKPFFTLDPSRNKLKGERSGE